MIFYLLLNLFLCGYLVVIIIRLLPLVLFAHQPLPFVPIPKRIAKRMARLPQLQNCYTFIDLGCGTGTILAALHRAKPQAKLTGVEYNPKIFKLAQWRTTWWKNKPDLHCTDMFTWDISQYDAIVGWWVPKFCAQLVPKLIQEVKPSCVMVCYMFPLPKHPALHEQIIPAGHHNIYVYTKVQSHQLNPNTTGSK